MIIRVLQLYEYYTFFIFYLIFKKHTGFAIASLPVNKIHVITYLNGGKIRLDVLSR